RSSTEVLDKTGSRDSERIAQLLLGTVGGMIAFLLITSHWRHVVEALSFVSHSKSKDLAGRLRPIKFILAVAMLLFCGGVFANEAAKDDYKMRAKIEDSWRCLRSIETQASEPERPKQLPKECAPN